MNPWPVIRACLRRHRTSAVAFALLVGGGVSLAVALVSQERAIRTGSARAADRFDLIVAAPGSQTDALMTGVFLRPGAPKLLAPAVTARLLVEPQARFAAPLAFGDSHAGDPVVGTVAALVEHLSGGLAEGRMFRIRTEAVVGAASPLRIGQDFQPSHGQHGHGDDDEAETHGVALTVVGRMRPTGSPWDRAVVVPVEFVWAVHALPDGHPPGSEAIGPPFDAAAVPGVPAMVVRPESVAGAYRLRSTYSTPQSMAFFPAEALLALYEVLGDMRRLMSLLALTTQGLLLLSVVSSVLILFRLLMPQFVTLRALGAPRRFVFAVAWGFTAVLVAIGVAAGIAGGYGVSFAISAALAAETGIALTPTLGWSELAIGAGILGIGLVLAALPAWIIQRRPLAEALISH